MCTEIPLPFVIYPTILSPGIGLQHEEIFTLIMDKELVNRGFLYGPYLPVYGFGAVFIVILLRKYKKYPLFFFFACMMLTGIVEYVTGALLMEIFEKRWWDYTGLFLNINGYICLRSLLTFAIGGLLLVYIIEPIVSYLIKTKSKYYVTLYTSTFLFIMLIDFIFVLIFRHKL